MGRPVYEQEELTNFSTSLAFRAGLALGPLSCPAQDQALQLGTNGDILVGRADNGAIPQSLTCLAPAPRPKWLCHDGHQRAVERDMLAPDLGMLQPGCDLLM